MNQIRCPPLVAALLVLLSRTGAEYPSMEHLTCSNTCLKKGNSAVCGTDSVSYTNQRYLACQDKNGKNRVQKKSDGKCQDLPSSCGCVNPGGNTAILCGKNNVQYGNPCEAYCKRVLEGSDGTIL